MTFPPCEVACHALVSYEPFILSRPLATALGWARTFHDGYASLGKGILCCCALSTSCGLALAEGCDLPYQLCIGSGASDSAGLAWVILVLTTLLFQDYNC